MVEKNAALPGRGYYGFQLPDTHYVNQQDLTSPTQAGHKILILGLGCFWGAERLFWQLDGVVRTAVGYAGGYTPYPTYEEVCSGMTGHTEVVWLDYDPSEITFDELLKVFWEAHDPTQGMRQGNDKGTQYRSAIYVSEDDLEAAKTSLDHYQTLLSAKGFPEITTEIKTGQMFYFAEIYHQQYLAKNPNGYCGLKGTGVTCV